MIKKVVFIAALVTLLVAPFVIQSLKATPYTWGCYSFANCSGSYQCSGDVMESPSRCRFRCKTGETYTVYFQCISYYLHQDMTNINKEDIQFTPGG